MNPRGRLLATLRGETVDRVPLQILGFDFSRREDIGNLKDSARREIAERMKLGIKTIGTYRDRIKQKLCIKSAAELTRHAVLWKEKEHFGSSE